jgi:hypothetical protein
MIRTSLLIAALLSASIAYAGDANVTLTGQKGTVMVNSGKQFVTAQPGQTLAAGDRVMVMEGGRATLTYPNGCVVTVNSGSMVNVSQQQCATHATQAKKVGTMYAQAVGDRDERKDDDDDRGHPPFWAVFAGFVVVTCALVVCRHDADGISTP